MLLIFVDNPVQAREVSASIQEKWPEELALVVSISSVFPTPFRFAFPSFRCSFPTLFGVNYTYNVDQEGRFLVASEIIPGRDIGESFYLNVDQTKAKIQSANRIVFACSPTLRNALSFHQLLENFKVDESKVAINLCWLPDDPNISTARNLFDDLKHLDLPEYQHAVQGAKAKRYFDFNFALNSYALLGQHIQMAGVSGVHFSKYMLQALFWIAENPSKPCLSAFSNWVGNAENEAEYGPVSLGCSESYGAILDNLEKGDLIEENSEVHGAYALTSKGKKLVGLIYPTGRDFDLPYRIKFWQRVGIDSCGGQINQYLFSFFKRIKTVHLNNTKAAWLNSISDK